MILILTIVFIDEDDVSSLCLVYSSREKHSDSVEAETRESVRCGFEDFLVKIQRRSSIVWLT